MSRFDLTRFNLGSERYRDISFMRDAFVKIDVVAGGRKLVDFTRLGRARIRVNTNMHVMIPIMRKATGVLFTTVVTHIHFVATRFIVDVINTSVLSSKNVFVARWIQNKTNAQIIISKICVINRLSISRINATAQIKKGIFIQRVSSSVIMIVASVTSTRFITLRLDVKMLPGQEIRINSDMFTATLGTENILHTVSGDWIYLDRGVQRIVIATNTGGSIYGELIYNERYI